MPAHDTPNPKNPPVDSPAILVVGSGAVGGFYGGKLARAGARVATVQRSDFEVIRQRGFAIESIDGDFHFTPHEVLRHAGEYTTPPEYLLVTLKSLPELDIPALIRPAVGPGTVIVLLQNGIDIEEPVARAFPENTLISALAFVCLQRIAPGRIRHLCFGRVTIGLYPSGASESVQRLARLFQAGGVPCQITEQPLAARWAKLVWNAAFNPVSVLAGHATTTEMLAMPACEQLIIKIMKEIVDVARAAGHELPESTVADNLRATRRMEPYLTSMALDHMANRPLESEAILGAAIRHGERHGIPTPCLSGLYAMLTLLTRERSKETKTTV
ncbi:MAG: 2-dehydropantoate 2-reductase [Magnetococcales bacterium]|nr:2-dehydropantoate 2-reductase [Magnetococcales bacterium]